MKWNPEKPSHDAPEAEKIEKVFVNFERVPVVADHSSFASDHTACRRTVQRRIIDIEAKLVDELKSV